MGSFVEHEGFDLAEAEYALLEQVEYAAWATDYDLRALTQRIDLILH